MLAECLLPLVVLRDIRDDVGKHFSYSTRIGFRALGADSQGSVLHWILSKSGQRAWEPLNPKP